MRRLWNSLLAEPLARIDREQRDFLASPAARRPDLKVMAVLVTVAVVLTLQNYKDSSSNLFALAGWLDAWGFPEQSASLLAWTTAEETKEIAALTYWGLFSFVNYCLLPGLVIVFVFRERLGDYGLKPHGALKDWPIYAGFFCVMVPLILWVSTLEHFQRIYPFYKLRPGEELWPYFWRWEAVYFLQFVGLEFFFRGFMVHGLKHRFGVYSAFVMTVPYCMIHFQKAMLETFAAIIAGVALGYMSLKTRSIWLGAAIHMSVAISMDLLSLWRQGYFG